VDASARYLRRYATIADTGSLAATNPLREAHQRVLPAVVTATGECAESLLNRAAAIRAAVRTYATADDASRADLDALAIGPTHHGRHPGSRDYGAGAGSRGDGSEEGGVAFEDGWVAGEQLRFPDDPPLDLPAWTVPGSWLTPVHRYALRPLRAVGAPVGSISVAEDGARRLARPLCGDWPGLHACGFAYGCAAQALATVAASLSRAAAGVGRMWTGNAAAACTAALVRDAGRIDRVASTSGELAAVYQPVERAARAAAAAVCTELSEGLDAGAGILGAAGPASLGTLTLAWHAVTVRRRLHETRRAARDAAGTALALADDLALPR
jgi:hypothetical protein